MNIRNITILLLVVVVVTLGGVWYLLAQTPVMPVAQVAGFKNISYVIEGQSVMLVNGRAETLAAPDSVSKVITQYFGNEATGDLNGDDIPDVAFLLTQTTGGSGIFYYAVAAIKTVSGYKGTSAVLLGDRIAPQTTEIRNGQLIVNYADRKAGEPMVTPPSEGKSLFLKLDPAVMQFGEVVQNFEGEADPSRMTLGMQTWTWISTRYNNDTTVTPKETKAFTLTFKDNGSFSATTDCNGIGGKYEVKGTKVTFSQMMSTLMYCDGSQEADFTKMLIATQSYQFTSKGELIFNLKLDTGSFIFH